LKCIPHEHHIVHPSSAMHCRMHRTPVSACESRAYLVPRHARQQLERLGVHQEARLVAEQRLQRDEARVVQPLLQVVASPSELLASPIELLASPSELLASPIELLASPSELLASPSELLASPSEL
jgi:hypothetical protein